MKYLRNTWYVAAWADELCAGQLLARTLLDVPVLMFRREDGTAVAILDRCPHRFAPLSRGCLRGDTVHCAYHGLGFEGSGKCTVNPHGPIRAEMDIPAFAVHEAHRALWIWMGDAQRADPALIPDLAYLDAVPASAFSKGYMCTRGNYEIFVDNILDLSHTDFLHPGTLAGGGITGTRPEVVEAETHIDVCWMMRDTPPPPLIAKAIAGLPERVDSFTRVRWFAPGIMRLVSGTMPAGHAEADAIANFNAHILTPETATSSHYFFAATRNFRVDDAGLNQQIAAARERIFGTEDKPMIEAIQDRMGEQEFWSMKPLLFSVDVAAVRVRRRLQALIEAENAAAPAAGTAP